MSGTRTQRIIAFILVISPWIYVPSVFKELGFIILAALLYLSTIDIRRKREVLQHNESIPTSPINPTLA